MAVNIKKYLTKMIADYESAAGHRPGYIHMTERALQDMVGDKNIESYHGIPVKIYNDGYGFFVFCNDIPDMMKMQGN